MRLFVCRNPDEAKRKTKESFSSHQKKSTNAPSIIFSIDLWKEKNICVLRGRIFKVASTFRLKVPLGAKCTLVIAELKIDSFKNFFWLLVTLMPKAKEWPSVQKKRTVTARKGNYWERWWWENTVLSYLKNTQSLKFKIWLLRVFEFLRQKLIKNNRKEYLNFWAKNLENNQKEINFFLNKINQNIQGHPTIFGILGIFGIFRGWFFCLFEVNTGCCPI